MGPRRGVRVCQVPLRQARRRELDGGGRRRGLQGLAGVVDEARRAGGGALHRWDRPVRQRGGRRLRRGDGHVLADVPHGRRQCVRPGAAGGRGRGLEGVQVLGSRAGGLVAAVGVARCLHRRRCVCHCRAPAPSPPYHAPLPCSPLALSVVCRRRPHSHPVQADLLPAGRPPRRPRLGLGSAHAHGPHRRRHRHRRDHRRRRLRDCGAPGDDGPTLPPPLHLHLHLHHLTSSTSTSTSLRCRRRRSSSSGSSARTRSGSWRASRSRSSASALSPCWLCS